jgi:hypothetical protein
VRQYLAIAKQALPAVALWALIISCAQIRGLEGGAKDTRAPQLIAVDPPNLTRNFSSGTIVFTFDEYVQINNLAQELIVSPPLKTMPVATVRKRSVELQLNEALLPNTTYVFQFGNAITDFTEGNKSELMYVVSTGPEIDSLEIRGNVSSVWTGKQEEGVRVMCFADTSTQVFKAAPRYLAKTDQNGNFTLPYLSEGKYHLVAIKESSENYLPDPGEAIAFADSLIAAADSSALVNLYLSVPREAFAGIEKFSTDSTGRLCIAWPADSSALRVNAGRDGLNVLQLGRHTNDSLLFWLSGDTRDQMEKVQVLYRDSVLDTLYVPYFSEAVQRAMKPKQESSKVRPRDPLRITWPVPVQEVGACQVSVMLPDSSRAIYPLSATSSPWISELVHPPFPQGKIVLEGPAGCTQSIHGALSDSLKMEWLVLSPKDMGTLALRMESEATKTLLLQVTDTKGVIIAMEPVQIPGTWSRKEMMPGDYEIRLIEDTDGDGVWDPANFELRAQPERVWVYSGKVSVRANWDLDLRWPLEP